MASVAPECQHCKRNGFRPRDMVVTEFDLPVPTRAGVEGEWASAARGPPPTMKLWRDTCRQCYEHLTETELSNTEWNKIVSGNRRLMSVVGAKIAGEEARIYENTWRKYYVENHKEIDWKMEHDPAFAAMMTEMGIGDKKTPSRPKKGRITRQSRVALYSQVAFGNACKQAALEGRAFGHAMIDNMLDTYKSMIEGNLKTSVVLIKDSLDWFPIKFTSGTDGPKLMVLYIQARLTPGERMGYWAPITGGQKVYRECHSALVPCQQGHWFCTKESNGKTKWRSGANGKAIYQNQEADGQGCCLLVLAVPDQDENGKYIHTEEENMNLQFLRICQPDKNNKVALDIFTIIAYCTEGGFDSDTIFNIWDSILAKLRLSNSAAERIMTPIKTAKVLYIVQNPRDADDFKVQGHPDAHLWKRMDYVGSMDDENIILLSEKHIGKALPMWNMDLVPSYNHGMIHTAETWTSILQSIKDTLPDTFFHKLRILLDTKTLTKSMMKFANSNLASWPASSSSSSGSASRVSVPWAPQTWTADPTAQMGSGTRGSAPWSPQTWTDVQGAPNSSHPWPGEVRDA
jgi:hypothetical protein